jgi:lipopolysaccharide transport system permease protein
VIDLTSGGDGSGSDCGEAVTIVTKIIDEAEAVPVLAPSAGDHLPTAALPVMVIEHSPGWRLVDLGELWRYRELLFFLTWRDVKVRYKQTVLGAAWAVLQPLATMLVLSLFFGRVAADASSHVPYSLFVLAGLVAWMFFSNAIATASQSVIGSQNLVTKVYFPRLFIPMGAVGAGLVDFAIALGLLVLMMAWHGVAPGWSSAFLPLLLIGLVIAALGVGTLLAALTVAYRDFRYVVPFMVQLWMFATPSIYLQADADAGRRMGYVFPLNPAYGLIANFRRAMLGDAIDWYSLVVSEVVGISLLLIGLLYFRRVEREFADII